VAGSKDVRQLTEETQQQESAEQSGQQQKSADHLPSGGEDAAPHGLQKRETRPAEGKEETHQPALGGYESGRSGAAQQSAAARRDHGNAHGDAQQKSGSEGDSAQHQPQRRDAQQQADASPRQQDKRDWRSAVVDPEERGDVRQLGRDVKTGGAGSQTGVGGFNTAQVVDVKERSQMPGLRRLQTEFYRVLEMLAEEKTRYFDPSLVGGLVKAEYDVKKMAMRRYEGKPPTRYKAPRVREAVVLVLDNSGSMFSWADMLRAMAELAAKRRDVEVYLAPNGYVEEQIAPVKRKVNHDEFMKRMSGRKIIYVGDFDGTNTPIELSWRNEVIWIAPESRYKRFKSHNWAKYDESKYKGAFIRAFTVDGIMKGLKKVLGGMKWIDMCMKCEDE